MSPNLKFVSGLVIGALATFSVGFIAQSNAQSTSSVPSGKYGCLVNKNFAGFDARLDGGTRIGYHYMLQFDLTNKTSQIINIHLIDNYGKSNVKTSWAAGADISPSSDGTGVIEIKEDPNLTGAFLIRNSSTSDSTKWTVTYVAMSVNGGNTLLVSSGAGANGDTTPFTGLCNKI